MERSVAQRSVSKDGDAKEGAKCCYEHDFCQHSARCHQRRGGYPALIETLRCATLLRVRVVRGASVFWLMVE